MLDVTEAVSGAIPYGMVAGWAVSTVRHYSSSLDHHYCVVLEPLVQTWHYVWHQQRHPKEFWRILSDAARHAGPLLSTADDHCHVHRSRLYHSNHQIAAETKKPTNESRPSGGSRSIGGANQKIHHTTKQGTAAARQHKTVCKGGVVQSSAAHKTWQRRFSSTHGTDRSVLNSHSAAVSTVYW